MRPSVPRVKITFKKSKRHNAVLMEGVYVRRDGAVQVRAVVPLEKARQHFKGLPIRNKVVVMGAMKRAGGPAEGLACHAAVGMIGDMTELAESQLKSLLSGVGWNPFKSAANLAKRAARGAGSLAVDTAMLAPELAFNVAKGAGSAIARKAKRGGGGKGGGGDGGGGDEGGGDDGGGDDSSAQDGGGQ